MDSGRAQDDRGVSEQAGIAAREANRRLSALLVTSTDSEATRGSGDGSSAKYIGNRNSKKFHYATCTYLGQMNPENKVPFATRSAAVSGDTCPEGCASHER